MKPQTALTLSDQATQYRRGVKALIERDGAVLLVQERHDDGTPFWTLPGGGVEDNESAAETLHRELTEELQCDGSIGHQVGRFTYAHQSSSLVSLYETHVCSIDGSIRPNPAEGVFASTWACPSELPDRVLPAVEVFVASTLDDAAHSNNRGTASPPQREMAND